MAIFHPAHARGAPTHAQTLYHPSSDKRFNVIRRENPLDATADVLYGIYAVQVVCDVCQREADAPRSFRVSLPGKTSVFKDCMSLYIIYLDGNSFLHAVDKDKKVKSACP